MKNIKNKRLGGEKGFTLIEVLTALLIVIIGLLAVGSLQLTAISGNSSANRESLAMAKAGDKLERLISLPQGDTSLAGNSTETVQDSVYTIKTEISDNTDNSDLADITVTVTWVDRGTRTRTRALSYTKIR